MKIKNYLLGLMLIASSVAFPQTGTTYNQSITSAGLTKGSTATRTNKLYVPTACETGECGLIVVYHGTGQTAAGMVTMCRMNDDADRKNFIVVYPEGLNQPNSGNTAWNVLGTRQEFMDTDYIFTIDMINDIKAKYNVNPCKIFATGFSIGGFMTHAVGREMSAIFAAIAPHSGNLGRNFNSTPTHPTPALIIHGDADGTVAFRQTDVDYWVGFDRCGAGAAASYPANCQTDAANVTFTRYPNGTNGSVVDKFIYGGGHTWHKDASCTIVEFFSQWCLDNLKGTPPACVQPSVTAQPSPKTICSGANTTFGITATGDGLTYQWQVDNGSGTFTNLTNAAPYSTVTTATLTITGATAGLNGYKYKCVVSGTCTPATPATSNQAILTIATAPTATVSGDATICSGTTATVSIALTGTGPWTVTKAVNGVNQAPVAPSASPYTFNASAAGVITVATVTNNIGCSGTSSGSATIAVNSAITTSTPIETCNGSNYSVEFDISGGDQPSYTVTGGTIANLNHFTSNPSVSGTSYSFTVNDRYNCSPAVAVTGAKTCTAGACNATATISGNTTICPGASATISIALGGTTPWAITYAIDGIDQTPVTANSSPYTFTASVAGVYTVTSVDDGSCTGGTSSGSATIAVNSAITTSTPIETCNGSNYTVEFDISDGDKASYTVTGGTIATTTHYISNPIASGTSYSITVTDSYNCNPVAVTGTKTCTAGACNATATISGNTTICPGGSATITVALGGATPWSFAYAINNGTPITATSNSATYTFAATAAGVYTLSGVTDNTSCTGGITGGSATIAVNSAITTSTPIETCNGSNYTVEFDISGGDKASYTVTGGIIATATHYISNPIPSGTPYSITVTDAYNCNPITVTGTKTCTAGACNATATISGNTTICPGGSATITVALGGATPWSFAYAINNGTPITATSNSATYTFAATAAGVYTLSGVTDNTSCTGTTSGRATVVVNTAITTSSAVTTCSINNSTYTVEFDISGGNPASYTVSGGTITNGNHFTSSPVNSGTAYSFTINDANNCAPLTVSGTKTCVNTGPCNATATMSGGGIICNGSASTLTVALTGQAPWNFTIDPGNITITNQNTSPFTITTTVSGTFSVTAVADATCTGTSSGSAVVTSCYVGPPPTGIEENSPLKAIIIYPNPTHGNFNISIKNANFNELQITVVDVLGKTIYSELEKGIASDFLTQINLEHIPSGMYYIKLSNGTDNVINKLIIQ